ncbi:mediator of RNA polymerase II transcription complex subunit 8-domain-containing protein [Jackrogersella minutella]|nr:mediator of RNA polymerase II transcription complex subunit 8-domain-containing protein [Jackrogersella minutella]
MASTSLTPEDYKVLEATRLRLLQISSGIGTLKANVFNSNPLPSLESLRNHADVLQGNIQSLLDITLPMSETFSRIAVHPATNFPGRTQEMILLQLLRKKAEPDVATAMDEGRKIFTGLTQASDPSGATAGAGGMPSATGKGPEELETIWQSTRDFCQQRIMEYVTEEANDMFTEEERQRGVENVRTGLKRSLEDEDDEDEDEEGDDDVMEIDRPPPPPAPAVVTQEVEGAALENVMRLATRGELVSR